MSGDELIVTVAALIGAAAGWLVWFAQAGSVDRLKPGKALPHAAAVLVTALSMLILIVLRTLAADDVRNAPEYVFMYFVLGLAWLRMTMEFYPLLGLNPRDDIFERGNRAALRAWAGVTTGVAFCYCGGNIGNGPGWWVVMFSAALATAALAAVWFVLGAWAGMGDAVVIDRDEAAGIRLGGALAACGLIFGTAVAGDWVSAPATVADFVVRAWPAALITVIVVVVERGTRPRPEQPRGPVVASGVLPALLYLVIAVALAYRGSAQW